MTGEKPIYDKDLEEGLIPEKCLATKMTQFPRLEGISTPAFWGGVGGQVLHSFTWRNKSVFNIPVSPSACLWAQRLCAPSGRQSSNLDQEPRSRSSFRDHGAVLQGLLSVASSVCFLRAPRTTIPEVTPLTTGWALPHQPLTKKMDCRLLICQS